MRQPEPIAQWVHHFPSGLFRIGMLKTLQHIVQVPQARSFAGDITEPIVRTYQAVAYDESRSEANSKATRRRHGEIGN